MLMKKKALLATALTSATFVALIAPDAAWAAPNVTEECAPGTQVESTQCGIGAQANAADSTAVGESAVVQAGADDGTAIGANSIVKKAGGTAVGADTKAEATNSVAIGLKARVLISSTDEAIGGVAIGHDALVSAAAVDAVAIGRGATSVNAGAVALGAPNAVKPESRRQGSGFILCDAAKARCKIRIYIVSLFKNVPGG
jgi:trimeric autotransporter adhesin